MSAIVKGRGQLAHHFWGTYAATIAIVFADAAAALDAMRVLVGWKLGLWSVVATLRAEGVAAFAEGDALAAAGFEPVAGAEGRLWRRTFDTREQAVAEMAAAAASADGLELHEPRALVWHGGGDALEAELARLKGYGAVDPASMERSIDRGPEFDVEIPIDAPAEQASLFGAAS